MRCSAGSGRGPGRSEGPEAFAARMDLRIVFPLHMDEAGLVCRPLGDGSLFVSTPYFGTGSGIVTRASIGSGSPYTISLRQGGSVTSHLVKLSHHPNGRVHFSQTGKVKTEIIRQSFRLVDSIGGVACRASRPTDRMAVEEAPLDALMPRHKATQEYHQADDDPDGRMGPR